MLSFIVNWNIDPNYHSSVVGDFITQSRNTIGLLYSKRDTIVQIATSIAFAVEEGKRVYTMGNGGSCAEAMHFAAELSVRFRYSCQRNGMPVTCLSSDPVALTAAGNDFSFEDILAHAVQAFMQPEDILIAYSTSGNSMNIVNALRIAEIRGCTTIGILGRPNSLAEKSCGLAINVEPTSGPCTLR